MIADGTNGEPRGGRPRDVCVGDVAAAAGPDRERSGPARPDEQNTRPWPTTGVGITS